ncbi:MAG: hypothetical protein KY475_10640 [Planctomycetes bacterium]|nr:hypothetical protein [Planctomycetota bacterium]
MQRILLYLIVTSLFAVSDVRAAEVERELLRRAPEMLEHCRSKGYRNVGVLKFRVKKGNDPISDSVGTFNSFLAERLETALILANSSSGGSPVGIIRDASAVAAKTPGAAHTSADGRSRLFAAKYPLAWGSPPPQVTPDAFITGIVVVSPDLRDMSVGILAFDRAGKELERIVPVFKADVGIDALAELGESYALRGAFDGGDTQMTEEQTKEVLVTTALKVKEQQTTHPLADPQRPVLLEAAYNGRPVSIEFRGGEAFLPEPQEGEQVVLTLRHNPGVKAERLAVVLKVNGENTLFRQRKRDIDCRKWILEPGAPPIVIRGYQKSDKTYEAFRVLSAAESREREIHYGADVGMISLTVFREAVPEDLPPPDLLSEEDEDLLAMMRGGFPEKPAETLGALKAQLRSGSMLRGGLIESGAEEKGGIRIVEFEPDPTPIMTAAIRYYEPASK